MYNGGMSKTRSEILEAVSKSRQASRKLAKILQEANCCVKQVQLLLDQGALVEEATVKVQERGTTRTSNTSAVEWVMDHDRGDILLLLYRAGSLQKGLTKNWMSLAISKQAKNCVGALIEAGEVRKRKKEHGDWIAQATGLGSWEIVEKLLAAGVDPNARFIQNEKENKVLLDTRALHWARSGRCVEVLLDAGADIDARNQHGCPPLHVVLDTLSFSGVNERKESLTQAAVALIERGAALLLPPDGNGWDWDILGPMNRMRVECTQVLEALARREDFHVGRWKGKVRSIPLLKALLEVFPEEDNASWAGKDFWRGVDVASQRARNDVVELLEAGVAPPKIQHVFDDVTAWLEIGVPVEPGDLEMAEENYYESLDGDYYDWQRIDPAQVAQSNAKALKRLARINAKALESLARSKRADHERKTSSAKPKM